MKVQVNIVSMHGDSNKGTGSHQMPEGTSVANMLKRLDLPLEVTYAVLLNDMPVGIEDRDGTILKDGDRMTVFPPIQGG